MKKTSFQEKRELEMHILEDPFLLPETKVVLLWELRKERLGKIEEREILDILHISPYKLRQVKKQLSELKIIAVSDL